eukprot:COSAG02_NODE_19576_length_875_cov_0.891753_1_plen_191_part_10
MTSRGGATTGRWDKPGGDAEAAEVAKLASGGVQSSAQALGVRGRPGSATSPSRSVMRDSDIRAVVRRPHRLFTSSDEDDDEPRAVATRAPAARTEQPNSRRSKTREAAQPTSLRRPLQSPPQRRQTSSLLSSSSDDDALNPAKRSSPQPRADVSGRRVDTPGAGDVRTLGARARAASATSPSRNVTRRRPT